MQVKFNPEFGPVSRTTSPAAKPATTSTAGEDAYFGQSQALNDSLTGLPALRVDKVERARALVLDAHYPPPEIQHKIATLLAVRASETK